ncbi:hypothetical protein KC19_2G277200 [Ceratodon purpureus]|uniref:Uncharacterized protein n=1 Tax=Ceratodon purpureus TaxID=3225 RepID=A0A8T0J2J2_CERPU|nr:hypothetical protein KC19_2G277200 [Ceratodon purpureus]
MLSDNPGPWQDRLSCSTVIGSGSSKPNAPAKLASFETQKRSRSVLRPQFTEAISVSSRFLWVVWVSSKLARFANRTSPVVLSVLAVHLQVIVLSQAQFRKHGRNHRSDFHFQFALSGTIPFVFRV